MKTSLTNEESQHLIDLGVPKEKASIWTKDRVIFKLEDFLNGKILPKEIVYYEDYDSEFTIQWNCSTQKWDVGYSYNMGFWKETRYSSDELIDVLYWLACWYYGEYLKSEKK